MDEITREFRDYYATTFSLHGATAKGVDWGDENELLVRYDKMLAVMQKDFQPQQPYPSVLDVGCGWGGLWLRAHQRGINMDYTGIDVVKEMIDHGSKNFPDAKFKFGDVFDLPEAQPYDFVVCNAILTQKLTVSNIAMEAFSRRLILKMFSLCKHGIAINFMSTRVNFTVSNLYYQNPAELLSWMLSDVSPRIRLDHGYSSLASGKGKFYDFTAYAYRD
jgi:2-polyprenyl-3-methyl-5-hydroxy-6-metoxy-1,4-benzoquinol methylase